MILKKYITRKTESLDAYRALGGLTALQKAAGLGRKTIIDEIKKSQLRGRAGAGFPTGFKLEMAEQVQEPEKFVICNADEGEVGTFKDRELLKNCPYLVLEGMMIAGLAVGARQGYMYLRTEYSYLIDDIRRAIEEMEEEALSLGKCDFRLELFVGAGAYICGEETALIESIEQRRGEPRLKPPYPTNSGLFGKPTLIINVETLSNLPWIIVNGSEAFSSIGTEMSKGTKLFSVSGDVRRPGVYELPLGTSLRVLVIDKACANDVKAVQIGGASGRIVAGDDLERLLCFEDVLGAGGVVVFNSSRNMVEMMRENMAFFLHESCGKCIPCREGNYVINRLLSRICDGDGSEGDLTMIREIAASMGDSSLCGLGISAPTGLLDTLQLFEPEFREAISAGV